MPNNNNIITIDITQMGDPEFERAFTFFLRHLVSLSGSYSFTERASKDTKEKHYFSLSGFIISIQGMWNFATAGHILSELEESIAQGMIHIHYCNLIDNFGPNTLSQHPIPFDYLTAHKFYLDDDEKGFDFGLITLSPMYKALLQANNIVPVERTNWEHLHTINLDSYYLVGLPSVLIATNHETTPSTRRLGAIIIPLTAIEASPELENLRKHRIAAKMPSDYPPIDIAGMSGGPILGFSSDYKGQYWVVAIQSGWIAQKKIIFGSPIDVYCRALEDALSEFDEDSIDDNNDT
jgi:hypothetical protein